MIYVSFEYFGFVLLALLLYYLLPIRIRTYSILLANIGFYLLFVRRGTFVIFGTVLLCFIFGLLVERMRGKGKRIILFLGICSMILPWLISRYGFLALSVDAADTISLLVPIGISFYTMQLIAYLVDVYHSKISAQRNPLLFIVFATFFPQLIQGPIPRYDFVGKQLEKGKLFDEEKFSKGLYLIAWGFFLKFMIADKAAIAVNQVFDLYPQYSGGYVWIGAVLYSFQLYADFLACTTLAQGVALLFGIELGDNFTRPYLAISVSDFWRRWHVSLSSWLKDYIYIPLGGNRKGKTRKYINIMITFCVSGIWHGYGVKYLVWGCLHAVYQVIGQLVDRPRRALYRLCGISDASRISVALKRVVTFLWITLAWVLFRAQNLKIGLSMIKNMFTEYNPWVFFGDRPFMLGLCWQEMVVLLLSLTLLYIVDKKQEKGIRLAETLLRQPLPIRWVICIGFVIVIMVFGTYGFGYSAQDFIYGGF